MFIVSDAKFGVLAQNSRRVNIDTHKQKCPTAKRQGTHMIESYVLEVEGLDDLFPDFRCAPHYLERSFLETFNTKLYGNQTIRDQFRDR